MSVPGYEHKTAVSSLRLISCDGDGSQDEGLFIPDIPRIIDYLADFEDAASYHDVATCAQVYRCVKEVYVPSSTLEVIDTFTTSRYSVARAAAAVLAKQWLTEDYNAQTWPKLAPAFEALLHDQNEVVVAKALQARKAFIASAPHSFEAERRIRAMRKLRLPHFAAATV